MGFDRPGISFEFAPKWEKQEDGTYKLIYIKNQDGKQEKSSGT
jgi:hypothetical protein